MTNDIKNLSIPAFLSNFEDTKNFSTNKYVTQAKLRLFYIGLTEDGRRFTKEFADELIKTIEHTPVVAFYDMDSEEFVGHAQKQNIYGIVPHNKVTFEVDETTGSTWATTDVLLFTGRDDEIGEIASKIIGKQHSLEMDPKTIEYKMIVEKGAIKEIEFTKGSFIGLSVVGDNQAPAFKGSSFFTTEDYEAALSDIKNFLKEEKTMIEEKEKKEELEAVKFSIEDFISKSYSVLSSEAIQKYNTMYGANNNRDYYVTEATPDSVVVCNYDGPTCEYIRYSLLEVTAGENVFPVFVTQEELDAVAKAKNKELAASVSIVDIDDNDDDKDDKDDKDDNETLVKKDDEDKNAKCVTLDNADAAELQEFRLKAKESLLETFKEFISENEMVEISKCINDYSVKELQAELSVKSMDFVLKEKEKEKAKNTQLVANIFTAAPQNAKEDIKTIIDKYK